MKPLLIILALLILAALFTTADRFWDIFPVEYEEIVLQDFSYGR